MTGGAPSTVTVAFAVLPLPPSTDVTALVTLFLTPAVVPVTFTLKVHVPFAGRVAPVRLIVPEPAVAVMVPPPHVPASPFGVATTSPAGRLSVKPTPVSAVPAFGLARLKVRL